MALRAGHKGGSADPVAAAGYILTMLRTWRAKSPPLCLVGETSEVSEVGIRCRGSRAARPTSFGARWVRGAKGELLPPTDDDDTFCAALDAGATVSFASPSMLTTWTHTLERIGAAAGPGVLNHRVNLDTTLPACGNSAKKRPG